MPEAVVFKLLTPPSLIDSEQSRKARIIFWLCWGFILMVVTLGPIECFFLPQNVRRWLTLMTVVGAACLTFLELNRRGRTRLTSHLLLWFLFFTVVALAWTAGGIEAPIVQVFPALCLIAGLLFGGRVGVGVGLLAALCGLGLVLAENAGLLPGNAVQHTSWSLWIGSVLVITLLLLLQYLAVESTNRALGEAREELIQRKKIEEALRASEEFRTRVFDVSRVPIVVMDAKTYRFVDCNSAAVQIHRFSSREQMLGRTPLEVSASVQYDGTASADKARYYVEKAMAEGSVVFEWRHQRLDGEVWDAEVDLMSFKMGERQLLQFTLRDTTERRQAAELLARERRFSEALFEAMPGHAYVINEDGKYLRWNRNFAEFYGVERSEKARHWTEFVHPLDRARVAEAFRKAFVTGQGSLKHISIRADGVEVPRFSTGQTLEWDGKRYGVAVSLDISELARVERDLRESEERFRSLFNAAMEGIMVHDQGLILDANRVFARLFGYAEPEELIGKNGLELLLPPATQAQIRRRWDLEENARFEASAVRRDGSIFLMEAESQPMKYRGRDARIISCRDITERKRAQDALRNAHEQLVDIIECLPDPTFAIDQDKKVLAWNHAIEVLSGVSKAEILGKGNYAYTIPFFGQRKPLLIDFLDDPPQEMDPAYKFVRRVGDQVFAESFLPMVYGGKGAHLWGVAAPLYDSAGKRWGAIEVIRDVTERIEIAERLSESERKTRAIFNLAFSFIGLLTPEGIVLEINQSALDFAGVAKEAILNRPFWETPWWRQSPDMQERIKLAVQKAAAGETVRFETTHMAPDGSPRTVDNSLKPMRDEQGRVVMLIPEGRDITERKQAEAEVRRLNEQLENRVAERTAQLEVANKELEAFSYSVSHDLRSPLRHITGYLNLLNAHAGAVLDEERHRLLGTVDGAAKRMARLIDDLLAFSRISRVPMRMAPINVNRLVEECMEDLTPDFKNRTVEWVVPLLPEVLGDRALIKQVLLNLLSNAVKYTCRCAVAKIEIGCRDTDADWEFVVRDNGVGFNMKHIKKLFGVFQRLHSDATIEGTGIGLANVRRVITRHGGRTWAQAEINRGAAFYFTLPKQAFTIRQNVEPNDRPDRA